jgi:hypothetical protein
MEEVEKLRDADKLFQDMVAMLEECPFLRLLAPWGEWSVFDEKDPGDSDDGPIFWVRPGEQV